MTRGGRQLLVRGIEIIVALLFIFSGFVKSVDPMGSAIKFNDYFMAFSLPFLSNFSTFFAVTLSVLELSLGLMLLFSIYKRATLKLIALFMLFFTVLTAIIYFTNPVSDCGCFGDAVKLTNGETFLKNIVFLSLIALVFILKNRDYKKERRNQLKPLILIALVALFAPLYALISLPLLDFLPYKVGVDIIEDSKGGGENSEELYQTILLYKSIESGKIEQFSLEDTTWYDTTKWEYIDTKTELIKEGEKAKISSFNIYSLDGEDATDYLIARDKKVAIFTLSKNDLSSRVSKNLVEGINYYISSDYTPVIISSLGANRVETIAKNLALPTNIALYNMDETTLKSFIRASEGVALIDGGVIKDKFNLNIGYK